MEKQHISEAFHLELKNSNLKYPSCMLQHVPAAIGKCTSGYSQTFATMRAPFFLMGDFGIVPNSLLYSIRRISQLEQCSIYLHFVPPITSKVNLALAGKKP